MFCYRLFENIPQRSSLGFGPGGGRWNHSGIPLIYSSNSVALTFLELYSIRGAKVALSKWTLATLEIPDELPILEMDGAPKNWNQRPVTTSTKDLGSSWCLSKESIGLAVPSARVPLMAYPKEFNILINPMHPEFQKIVKVIDEMEVSFAID